MLGIYTLLFHSFYRIIMICDNIEIQGFAFYAFVLTSFCAIFESIHKKIVLLLLYITKSKSRSNKIWYTGVKSKSFNPSDLAQLFISTSGVSTEMLLHALSCVANEMFVQSNKHQCSNVWCRLYKAIYSVYQNGELLQ